MEQSAGSEKSFACINEACKQTVRVVADTFVYIRLLPDTSLLLGMTWHGMAWCGLGNSLQRQRL